MDKMTGESMNIVKQNLEKLKEIFPEIFSEDKIDFKKLQEELGQFTDTTNERYNFTWNGKQEAKKIAQTPSTGTLRPSKVDSKNWDTTQNLYIEGDNLEVLKLLQKSYHKKVKMIYIDPPYNTGKDFVYKDNFKDNIKNYLELTGQVDSDGNRLSTNSDTNGRYHSDWLSMMYPRLKLARNLLKDDGVIFISIDDNEVSNLRKLCDEIFGEDNFVGLLPTVMNLKGNNDEFGFAGTHEHTIVYVKNKLLIDDLYGIPLEEQDIEEYNLEDDIGFYKKGATLMRTGEAGAREMRPKGYYPIYVSNDLKRMSIEQINDSDIVVFPKTKNGKEMSWRRSKENLSQTISEFIITGNIENVSFYKKQRLEEAMKNGKKAKSLFYKSKYSSGNGTSIVKDLFNDRVFDNPKPIELIKDFISIGCNNDLVLDFFSGSSTTAHSIMQLNSKDKNTRKFIMVQLPEETNNKEFPTICEIGKERIRRAGDKIVEESGNTDLDIGFKVLKLDSSNIKEWDSDFDNLAENLLDSVDNIKTDRTSEDLLYEILLKYGLDLTISIEEKIISDKKVFVIGFGALVVCLDDEVTIEVVEKIAELKEELESETMRVVFKDSSFASAVVKTNAIEVLKQFGIDEVVSV